MKRGKTDEADAEAICEAVARPTMRFVPVKTAEQRAALVLHRTRDLLVRQRTVLTNALRGHMAEFGVIAPQGAGRVGELVAAVVADEEAGPLPPLARRALLVWMSLAEPLVTRAETERRVSPGYGRIPTQLGKPAGDG